MVNVQCGIIRFTTDLTYSIHSTLKIQHDIFDKFLNPFSLPPSP